MVSLVYWYQKKVLFAVVISFFVGRQLTSLARSKNLINFTSDRSYTIENKLKDNWLASEISSCQQVNPAYQEVYSFETENYYINICQLGSNFYYRRQSKYDESKALLVPATILIGNVFQATRGKTTYFVGKDGDRHYSSVMQNNNEIVFEPELQLQPSTVSEDSVKTNTNLKLDDL